MKYTFSTLPFMDKTAEDLKKICVKYGIDAVELREGENSLLDTEGLPVVDIASSICFIQYDKDMIQKGKKAIDLAKKLKANGVRVFLGNFARTYDAPKMPIDYNGIVQSLQELCDYSQVEIWVETHNEFATGKVLQKLISDASRGNLKIIWDIMHPIEDGEPPAETWEYIGKYIAHIHIKDGRKKADPLWHDFEYTPIGEGDLPIGEIVTILYKNNYSGYLSLEWENVWRDELKQYPDNADFIIGEFIKYMKNLKVIDI